jgi:hypothetical protein
MSEASELRGFASQCWACAQSTRDPETRARWLEMAQKWQRLAKQAEEQWQNVLQQQQMQAKQNEA